MSSSELVPLLPEVVQRELRLHFDRPPSNELTRRVTAAVAGSLHAAAWSLVAFSLVDRVLVLDGTALAGTTTALAAASLALLRIVHGSWSKVPRPERILVVGSTLAIAHFGWSGIWIHEGMHAAAAHLLYKDVRPIISVWPFRGGLTEFHWARLTRVGEVLGKQCANALTASIGVVTESVLAGTTASIGARFGRRNRQEIEEACVIYAIVVMAGVANYGFGAALPSAQEFVGHDFIAIQNITGISPIAMTVGLLALPIIAYILSRSIGEREAERPLLDIV